MVKCLAAKWEKFYRPDFRTKHADLFADLVDEHGSGGTAHAAGARHAGGSRAVEPCGWVAGGDRGASELRDGRHVRA